MATILKPMQQRNLRTLTVILCAAILLTLFSPFTLFQAAAAEVPPYQNTLLSAEERAADLVSRMTRNEKQTQLRAHAPAIPRLGLRQYMYQNEALHGMAKTGGTSFSSPIGMASSWNLDLMKKTGSAVSDEIRAYYNVRTNEGLSYWSPTINIHRDPRWGRNEESYSEDPFLTAAMGEMFVLGMQYGVTPQANPNRPGEDYVKTIPTLKHYAANNSEANREDGSSTVNNKLMRDYYTWAFQKITERTNVASVMTAYNAINGVPAAANDYLNNTLLRKVFGFTGYIVGDCGALTNLVEKQHYINNWPEAVALGLQGGTDQDCGGGSQNWIYDKWALDGIDKGFMTEDDMDRALIRTLALRFRTGEFDGGAYTEYKTTETDEIRDQALLVAQQSAILLENKNNALPIVLSGTGAASNINVYGPLARRTDLGEYSGNPTKDMLNFKTGFTNFINAKPAGSRPPLSFYDGMTPTEVSDTGNMLNVRWIGFGPGQIRHASRDAKDSFGMNYEGGSSPATSNNLYQISDGGWAKYEGVNLSETNKEFRVGGSSPRNYSTQAIFHLDSPEGIILGVVTIPPTNDWHSYSSTPPGSYAAITASTWRTAGFSTAAPALGNVTAGTMTINYDAATAGSYFATDILDQQMANGNIRDIYVEFIYRRDNQIQNDVIANAETGKNADSVSVVYVGTTSGFNGNYSDIKTPGYDPAENNSNKWGAFKVGSEHADRKSIKLPANQEELIDKVVTETRKHNGKVVVVIQSMGCMDVSAFKDKVDAILWTPYNGQRQAEALSTLLVGDYNPGGHTTQTWYKDDSQLTDNKDGFLLNYDIIPAKTDGLGRTYMYMTGTPQYPFGYGLSYTNFTVTNVTVDKTAAAANDKLQVTATVTNTGDVKGAEVVQVYFKAPNAGNGAVPKKQLCGFARVELAPKASQTVTIQVDVSDFSAIDETTVGDFDPDRSKIDPQNVDLNTVSGGGHGKRIVKTGNYTLEVGNSSVNVAGSATVNVTAGLADKVKLVTLEYSKLTMMIGQTMPAPTLSVCLSDETFPTTGYTVTYASSSPAVTVDPATGAATAASGGTALITATVTYKGQTYTGTAPVAVANYPYVTDIKIDGAVLNGFSINRDRYEYTVPYSQGAMPAITFTNPDPAGITAELKMPSKINGRATLTVSKPGEQTMTYIIDMAYPADPNNNPLIGTIRKDSGMVSRINGTSELYTDWGQGEIILSEDGGTGINLLNAKYNPENIWLTFTLSISGNQEKYPNFAQHVGSGSSINFRSGERTGFGEGRFGWYMSREWNLHYGDNYVRVPLYHALTKPADYFINNDKDINVDTYQIEVNGAQVSFSSSVLTRERIRGYIYFSDVKQVLCNIQTTGISSADIGSFATKIDDFRFVDESGKELVASKRAALQEALTAAADETRGSYTKGSWAAYTETLVTAARVAEFADEVEPFNYYLDLISNRDKGVLRQLGFVEESADKDKVSVTDARMVLQHLVQKITLTPAQLDAAAVDGAENDDGSPKVSITDARLILQYLVEKINKFPATE